MTEDSVSSGCLGIKDSSLDLIENSHESEQHLNEEMRESIREDFDEGCSEIFIERIERNWDKWVVIEKMSLNVFGIGVSPKIIQKGWREVCEALGAFLDAYKKLPPSEKKKIEDSYSRVSETLAELKNSAAFYHAGSREMDTQSNKNNKGSLQSFVNALVWAYYESFNDFPRGTAKGKNQKFQDLAWKLSRLANLHPSSHLERFIHKGNRELKEYLAAKKL